MCPQRNEPGLTPLSSKSIWPGAFTHKSDTYTPVNVWRLERYFIHQSSMCVCEAISQSASSLPVSICSFVTLTDSGITCPPGTDGWQEKCPLYECGEQGRYTAGTSCLCLCEASCRITLAMICVCIYESWWNKNTDCLVSLTTRAFAILQICSITWMLILWCLESL